MVCRGVVGRNCNSALQPHATQPQRTTSRDAIPSNKVVPMPRLNGRRRCGWPPRRAGSITPFLLLSLMVLAASFAIAVDYIFLWQTRAEMQSATDAASLAAAQALVDDAQLTGDSARIEKLFEDARANAVRYALMNRVLARPVQLDPNYPDLPGGDVLFGTLDHPGATVFVPAQDTLDPFNTGLANVNAVRVANQRTATRGNPIGIPLGGLLLMPTVDVVAAS